VLPSSRFPFLSVETDGRRKDKHSRLVQRFFNLLRCAGVQHLNLAHVQEGGLDGRLPLVKAGKIYDIAFVDEEGEIILLEIMRTYQEVKDGKG
jgi:hypothetical protein